MCSAGRRHARRSSSTPSTCVQAGVGKGRTQTLDTHWPVLVSHSQIVSDDLENPAAVNSPWRADAVTLPGVSYRVSPQVVRAVAFGLGRAARHRRHRARGARDPVAATAPGAGARAEPQEPEEWLAPLEHALVLLEADVRSNGGADQRRALELVAEELEARDFDTALARRARDLAWSEDVPPVSKTRVLATQVRAAIVVDEPEDDGTDEPGEAMRLWPRRRRAVESGDALTLTFARRRTLALRIVLAGAALALLAAAAASARHLDVRERGFLPRGSTGVVVLDLSLSIEEKSYPDVQRAIRRLLKADAPVGLVVFSDVPYELLPPGTPASELKPLLRVLAPTGTGTPQNPWWQSFRAGTRISSALDLARGMLIRDKVKDGYIVLVSDLETAPEDVEVVSRSLRRLQQEHVDVRLIPLAASSDGIELFQGILGKHAFVGLPEVQSQVEQALSAKATSPVPTALLVLGGLLFLVLALHEGFAGRLALPASRPEKVAA